MNKVLTIIMAGGEGTRLSVLVNRRAKPAVPFGGIYRIIDFPLSNAMHSGARSLGVIAQYRPYSLTDHIGLGEWWGLTGIGRTAKILSPHTGDKDSSFYYNTADAIYRNIEFIERFPQVTDVLILSGDHIYKMDYRPMLDQHRQTGADLTLATQTVPWEETSRFGIMVCDDQDRVTQFQEKPRRDPLSNKASLGIYIFNREKLIQWLKHDHNDPESKHDFGGDIIPAMINSDKVYNYTFDGYWRDVGTIRSYMDTSMEALDPESGLDLERWGVRTNHMQIELSAQHPMHVLGSGHITRSLISKGAHVMGEVSESILSPGVVVKPGARVHRCILLNNVIVEEGAVIEDLIADKHCVIGPGVHLGDRSLGEAVNDFKPNLLDHGTCVLGKGARIGPDVQLGMNTLIFPGTELTKLGPKDKPAGGTFFPTPATPLTNGH